MRCVPCRLSCAYADVGHAKCAHARLRASSEPSRLRVGVLYTVRYTSDFGLAVRGLLKEEQANAAAARRVGAGTLPHARARKGARNGGASSSSAADDGSAPPPPKRAASLRGTGFTHGEVIEVLDDD